MRAALLCAKETVPTLKNDLVRCEKINKIKIDSLYAILSHKDRELDAARSGPGWFTAAGYILTGALVGATAALAIASSR